MVKKTGFIKTSDGMNISYDLYSRRKKSVIVIAHGFFNSKDSVLIRKLIRVLFRDFDVLCFDFRGHGKSSGLFYWTTKEPLDLRAVLEFAKAGYDAVGVVGFSLGAAISIITLAKWPLAQSLVCVSGPAEFEKIDYHFWELDVENDIFYNLALEGRQGKGVRPGPFWLTKDKPVNLIGKIQAPVMFVHGDQDWVIKPWHSELLFKKTNSEKSLLLIKNGPHAEYLLRKNPGKIIVPIKTWFRKTINGQKPGSSSNEISSNKK